MTSRKRQFGEPIIENPTYDLTSAQFRAMASSVIRHCYRAHVRICSFADAKIDAHMKGMRKYFEESANVYTVDSSEDGKSMLLFVEGPRDPPGYYLLPDRKDAASRSIGVERKALARRRRARGRPSSATRRAMART